jgi:hypothetical protein
MTEICRARFFEDEPGSCRAGVMIRRGGAPHWFHDRFDSHEQDEANFTLGGLPGNWGISRVALEPGSRARAENPCERAGTLCESGGPRAPWAACAGVAKQASDVEAVENYRATAQRDYATSRQSRPRGGRWRILG